MKFGESNYTLGDVAQIKWHNQVYALQKWVNPFQNPNQSNKSFCCGKNQTLFSGNKWEGWRD